MKCSGLLFIFRKFHFKTGHCCTEYRGRILDWVAARHTEMLWATILDRLLSQELRVASEGFTKQIDSGWTCAARGVLFGLNFDMR